MARTLTVPAGGGAIGCEVAIVKGPVLRARAGLIERREARGAGCEEVQQELATARGGSFRRGKLRHHLRSCSACSHYLEEVRAQRKRMALILPVIPTAGLKTSVLAALGIGGGASGGGGAAGGGGLLAGVLPATGATVAKVAVVGVLAGGAGVAGETALDGGDPPDRPAPAITPESARVAPRSLLDKTHSTRPGERRGLARGLRARARVEKRGRAEPNAAREVGRSPDRRPGSAGPAKPLAVTPELPVRVPSPQLPSARLPSHQLPSPQLPSAQLPSAQLPSPEPPAPQLPATPPPPQSPPATQPPSPQLPSP